MESWHSQKCTCQATNTCSNGRPHMGVAVQFQKVQRNEAVNNYVDAEAHVHLIKALRAKDGKKARAAIRMDIVRGGESLLGYLTGTIERHESE